MSKKIIKKAVTAREVRELKINIIGKLKNLRLPNGWETVRLDIEFVKTNVPYPVDRQRVVYDFRNEKFYLRTPRDGNIYEEHADGVLEGIEVMRSANKIIQKI